MLKATLYGLMAYSTSGVKIQFLVIKLALALSLLFLELVLLMRRQMGGAGDTCAVSIGRAVLHCPLYNGASSNQTEAADAKRNEIGGHESEKSLQRFIRLCSGSRTSCCGSSIEETVPFEAYANQAPVGDG